MTATTVDLVGNNASLKKALSESTNLVQDFAGKVKTAFAVIGAAFVAREIASFGLGWMEAANESEKAFVKLQAVVQATGGAAGFTAEQMAAMADQMQTVTEYESETVQQAQAIIATFRNIRGDVFIGATNAAADMAAVLGMDLASAATLVSKALNDPLQGITALTRAGVTFTDQQKDQIAAMIKAGDVAGAQKIILEELKSEYGGAAEAIGETFSGKLTQMQNRLGDVGEELGAIVVDIIDALLPIGDAAITVFENVTPYIAEIVSGLIEMGSEILASLSPVFEWLVDAGITTFTGLEMVVTNFSDIASYAIMNYALVMVREFEIVKHWLTEVIPSVLTWFAENWIQIFTDIANANLTILTNIKDNVYNFLEAIASYLSGGEFDFEFKSLTEGFETAIKKLPEIAQRIPSELETSLVQKIDAVGSKLGDTFGEKFNEKKKFLGDLLTPRVKPEIDLTNTAEKVKAENVKQPKPEKEKKEKEDKPDKEEKAKQEKPEKDKGHSAQFEDLASLNSRIQAAAASSQKDEPTKELTKTNKDLNQGINKLSNVLYDTTTKLSGTVTEMLKNSGFDTTKTLGDGLNLLGQASQFFTDPEKLLSGLGGNGVDGKPGMFDSMAAGLEALKTTGANKAGEVSKESEAVAKTLKEVADKQNLMDVMQINWLKSMVDTQKETKASTDRLSDNISKVGTLQ